MRHTKPNTVAQHLAKAQAAAAKLPEGTGKQALLANLVATSEALNLYTDINKPDPIAQGFGAVPDMEDLETIRQKAWPDRATMTIDSYGQRRTPTDL